MQGKGLKRIGDFFGFDVVEAFNRTGVAQQIGDICALNFDFVNATFNTITRDDNDFRRNAVACTTENLARVVIVATQPVLPGKIGRYGLVGEFDVRVNTPVAGNFIIGANGLTVGTPQTLTQLDGLTTPTKVIGMCYEGGAGIRIARCAFNGLTGFAFAGGGA